MAFLSSLYLLGLLSLPIPFIIHLFERKRAPRIEFPWLHIVEESITGGNLFLRLKEWILLLVRTLILLLIVFAFANPYIKGKTISVILDDSYDMFARDKDGILFERAKDVASEISAKRNTDVLLLSGREYKPDILPAYSLFQLPDEDKNNILITSKKAIKTKNTVIIEGEKNMVSIDTVYLTDPLFYLLSNKLIVGITNYGEYDVRKTLRCIINNDSLNERVNLPPGKSFYEIPVEFGEIRGMVDIGDDGLRIDNVYYFSFVPLKKNKNRYNRERG